MRLEASRVVGDALVADARAAGRTLAVGFEMFQRPFQAVLSAFVQGKLDEAGLLLGTEYATRWGYDFAFYRPLVEGARDYALPALALNARRELVRAVGRGGLAALTEAELAELPELDLEDAEHQAFVYGLFGTTADHAPSWASRTSTWRRRSGMRPWRRRPPAGSVQRVKRLSCCSSRASRIATSPRSRGASRAAISARL